MMKKNLFISIIFLSTICSAYCHPNGAYGNKTNYAQANDSIKLKVEGTNAYYQQAVKVDSDITENKIYMRALEFMAAKNFQQNYGYDEEGKLICTTTQDLNTNVFSVTDEGENTDPYTVQFAITVDMKNRRYRYTINNIVFYLPTGAGNMRLSMYEMYLKATNTDSRRIAKEANKVISSFETYLGVLTDELYQAIEQKRPMDNAKF